MSDVKRFYAPGLDCLYRSDKDAPRELIPLVLESDYAKLEAEAQALREEVAALRARVVVVPDDLLHRCREILDWQRTGVLKGNALRSLGRSRWGGDPNELQIAEAKTAREAYRFIDELARLNGKAVSMADISACLDAELREWTGDHRKAVERALTDANGRIRDLLSERKEGDGHA